MPKSGKQDKKKHNITYVDVSCVLCGSTHLVRRSTVKKYKIFACMSHHASVDDVGVVVGEGETVVVNGSIGNFFDGFKIMEKTFSPDDSFVESKRTKRAIFHAQNTARVGTGLPPLEPDFDVDDDSWIDNNLYRRLVERLGDEQGWEIADYAREYGHGKNTVYTVKVYTEWGWAGFVDGTPGEIGQFLEELREKFLDVLDSGQFCCPKCGVDLYQSGSPCGCGTVLWHPQSWNAGDSFTGFSSLCSYVSEEKVEDFLDTMRLSFLFFPSDYSGFTDMLPILSPKTPCDFSVEFLEAFLINTRWVEYNSVLYGIIPVDAECAKSPIFRIEETLNTLGYIFEYKKNYDYGNTTIGGYFVKDESLKDSSADSGRLPNVIGVECSDSGNKVFHLVFCEDTSTDYNKMYGLEEIEKENEIELYDVFDIIDWRGYTKVDSTGRLFFYDTGVTPNLDVAPCIDIERVASVTLYDVENTKKLLLDAQKFFVESSVLLKKEFKHAYNEYVLEFGEE